MELIALLAFLKSLGYALVGFGVLMTFAAYMDRRISKMQGGHFKKIMETIHADSNATARYYGLRFVGLCILVASFVRG